jgi:hypothetical protein
MLFRETVAVYCENHTEHADTLCGQNAEFQCDKACGTYTNHWALKGYLDTYLQSVAAQQSRGSGLPADLVDRYSTAALTSVVCAHLHRILLQPV